MKSMVKNPHAYCALSSLSERELWLAFKGGNSLAFDYMFNQYATLLVNYGDRITREETLVEDCVQELFMELWEKRKSLGETSSIKFYLMASLRRKIIRKLQRKQKFNNQVSYPHVLHSKLVEHSYEAHLIEEQIGEEQKEKIYSALEMLSERQRQAIVYKFYDRLSYAEIAELMSLNVKAIYDLVYQGLKSLKKHLKKTPLFFLTLLVSIFL